MKKILTLLSIIFLTINLNAQKIGNNYVPALNDETPEWFKVFYDDEAINNVNYFEIKKQAEEYKRRMSEEASIEGKTNKAYKDIYTLYFRRWAKTMKQFVQNDGKLEIRDTPKTYERTEAKGKEKGSRGPTSSWSLVGPVTTHRTEADQPGQPQNTHQVNIYACALAASNTNVLYAAAETGGIFKTIDKGMNWTLAYDVPYVGNTNVATWSGDPFYSIGVDPTNPDIVYAGRKNLIVKSINGGVTWTDLVAQFGDVYRILIDPTNTSKVYVAGNLGTFTSIDAGATWTKTLDSGSHDVALKPGTPNTVYSLRDGNSGTQFNKSTDSGVTWTEISMGPSLPQYTKGARMTVSANDPNIIYVVVLGNGADHIPFIFKSTDSGNTWTFMCSGQLGLTGNNNMPLGMSNGQGFYDLDIFANPSNANEVIVGTTSTYKSTNGGTSFTAIGGYNNYSTTFIHADLQSIAGAPGETWVASDGGLDYSSDFFTLPANQSARVSGLFGTDYWGFTQGWNEDIMAGGRYHNGNAVQSENWPSLGHSMYLGGGENPTGYYMIGRPGHIAFSDMNGRVAPTAFNGVVNTFSFSKTPNESSAGFDASEIEFAPNCYNHVYSGKDNALWKSTNGGTGWTMIYDFGENVHQYEISRSNPLVMYLVTETKLMKTINGGTVWTQIPYPPHQSKFYVSLTTSYTDENTLWITAEGNNTPGSRVFKSTDGGTTWINLTTPTIDGKTYRNIVHQGGTSGGVYILAKGGSVYFRNNNMSDWASFSNSLPIGYSPLKTKPFYRDEKLRTAGNRGIWQVDMFEESAPIAQPTVDKLEDACVQDTFYIDDFSILKHAGATWTWAISPTPSYISNMNARNPKVVFGATGTYTCTLTVTQGGNTSSKALTVSILTNKCGVETVPGKALKLSSNGDHGQPNSGLGITTNTITLSAWIKPSGGQSSDSGILSSGNDGGTGMNYHGNNILGYTWRNETGSWSFNSGLLIPENQWSHVALVVSPTSATVYLNGMPSTRNANHAAVNFASAIQFGIDRDNNARTFKGEMDEVCIYNRSLSTDEIRELMNLTRNNPNAGSSPQFDASLIGYYQFNEGAGLPCYDAIGGRHTTINGTASKSGNSTAPVGGGTFQRMSITNGGLKDFSTPGVELTFPNTGTYPNGDVVVTRLDVPSDVLAGASVLPDLPVSYYVVRNYGTNSTFTGLTNMKFKNVKTMTDAMAASPADFKLFKRGSNAFGPTWGASADDADVVTNASETGTIEFSTGLNITSFSQFSIENKFVKRLSISGLRLQGAMPASGTTMTTGINSHIPLTDPYGTGVTATAIPSNAVDWVKIELKTGAAANTATTVATTSAFVLSDGTVKSAKGLDVSFNTIASGNYFIAISHRNHLGIVTSLPIALTGETAVAIDFATIALYTDATITNTNTTTVNGVKALWAGDVDSNGRVRYLPQAIPLVPSDALTILSTGLGGVPTASLTNTYSVYDVNMDGKVKYLPQAIPLTPSDALYILSNTLGGVPSAEVRAHQ